MHRRLFAAVVMVILCVGWAGAQTTQTAVCPLYWDDTTTVTLDGIISAGEWVDANWYYFDSTNPAANPGWAVGDQVLTPDDWSCSFALKHDNNSIYILTVVTDDAVVNDGAGNQWEDDAVEIYFDSNNSRSAGGGADQKEGDATGFQMSYEASGEDTPGSAGVGGSGYALWWWAGPISGPAAHPTGSGYVLEFRVDMIQTAMVAGGSYGFELSPDDDDDGGTTREHQIWWNNLARDDAAWDYEAPWGIIQISAVSNPKPLQPPAAPTNLQAIHAASTMAFLAWTDNSSDEEGFRIFRSEDGGTLFNEVGTVGSNVTGYADKTVHPRRYHYKVAAFNTAGQSADSNVVEVFILPGNMPIIEDLFEYPQDADLIGLAGGVGWGDFWEDRIGGSAGKLLIKSGRVERQAAASWAAVMREFYAGTAALRTVFESNRVYYASWDVMQPSLAVNDQRAYPSFFLGAQASDEVVNLGYVEPTDSPDHWVLRAFGPSGPVRSEGPPINYGQPQHAALQFVLKDSPTSDRLYAWIDPDPAVVAPPDMMLELDMRTGTNPEIDRVSIDVRELTGYWIDNFQVRMGGPNPIRNFTATAGNGKVTLTWDDPMATVLESVRIYRRTDRFPAGAIDGTLVFDGAGNEFVDVGLAPDTTYYYTAVGYDGASFSEWAADSATVVSALDADNWGLYR